MSVPDTARAAVVTAYDEPLELREYPLRAPDRGAVVVSVECATICGTDVHAWEGMFAELFDIELPVILGHEVVGRVEAIGAGAERDSVGTPLKLGDRIVWAPETCGQCYFCTVEKMPTLCVNRRYGYTINADVQPHFHGGFAEYTYVQPRSARLVVPDDVESEWAAASSCALRSVINAWERLGVVDYRHTVVIQGAGPLGLFATAVARTHNPKLVIVIGAPDARLRVAEAWGADMTISVQEHPDPAERVALVRAATEGRGGDVVGEFSGGRTAFTEGIELTAINGRYVVAGTVGGPDQTFPASDISNKNLSIYGSRSASIDHYYKALTFIRAHRDRFEWDLMLGGRYGLEELTLGLERMQQFTEIKAVVVPGAASRG